MAHNSLTLPALALKIQTEADAYKFLEELRWGSTPEGCLHCGEVGSTYLINPENGVSRKTRTGYKTVAPHVAKHEFVTHEHDEYVRHGVSTNLAEGYFSQLKRSLDGTHHHVSPENLQRYLHEFDFRYSTCKMDDAERVRELIERVPLGAACRTGH